MIRDSSPDHLRRGVEASLRRLGVDYIDIVYVHWPDPGTPFAASAAALAELVSESKVRWVGVSNVDTRQLAAFAAEIPVTAVQPPFHMLRRGAADELFPACRVRGIGVAAYSPLAHGLLAGSVTRERRFHSDAWRRERPEFGGSALERNLAVVEDLARVASARGIALPTLAIGWVLAHEDVTSAIVGARNPKHLRAAIEAPELELSDEELAGLEEILTRSVPSVRPPS
jgi:aryl-alcohol dehydrogenase-like predicted oxidoreductase